MKILNERGFMLLSVIILTLIVSIGAKILLNANVKVQQRNSTLYLTAINLANEQFAELESLASTEGLDNGSYDFQGDNEDLISHNGVDEGGTAIEFDVSTNVSPSHYENMRQVTVKVKWTANGEENSIVSEKIIRVNSISDVEGKSK